MDVTGDSAAWSATRSSIRLTSAPLRPRRAATAAFLLCGLPPVCVREFTERGCYGPDGGRVFRPGPACPGTGVEAGHFRMFGCLSEFVPRASQILREFRRQGLIRCRRGFGSAHLRSRGCSFSLKEISEAHFFLPSDGGKRMAKLHEGFRQTAAQSLIPNSRASILISTTALCPSLLNNCKAAGLAPLRASASRPAVGSRGDQIPPRAASTNGRGRQWCARGTDRSSTPRRGGPPG
jgi:hypothetical protein